MSMGYSILGRRVRWQGKDKPKKTISSFLRRKESSFFEKLRMPDKSGVTIKDI
jgi:hypothetical protein